MATAAATASFPRRKAMKKESPCVSTSRPWWAATAARTISWCSASAPEYAGPSLLEELRRALDVREEEGDVPVEARSSRRKLA